MWVKPTLDPTRACILDPVTKQPLPIEGREVSDFSTYWNRRIADGDVERVEAPAEPITPAPSVILLPAPVTSGGAA